MVSPGFALVKMLCGTGLSVSPDDKGHCQIQISLISVSPLIFIWIDRNRHVLISCRRSLDTAGKGMHVKRLARKGRTIVHWTVSIKQARCRLLFPELMAQSKPNNCHNHSDDDFYKKWLSQTSQFKKFV